LIEAGMVPTQTRKVKVILSGEVTKAVTLKGVVATAGAAKAIEQAGGSIVADDTTAPADGTGGE